MGEERKLVMGILYILVFVAIGFSVVAVYYNLNAQDQRIIIHYGDDRVFNIPVLNRTMERGPDKNTTENETTPTTTNKTIEDPFIFVIENSEFEILNTETGNLSHVLTDSDVLDDIEQCKKRTVHKWCVLSYTREFGETETAADFMDQCGQDIWLYNEMFRVWITESCEQGYSPDEIILAMAEELGVEIG